MCTLKTKILQVLLITALAVCLALVSSNATPAATPAAGGVMADVCRICGALGATTPAAPEVMTTLLIAQPPGMNAQKWQRLSETSDYSAPEVATIAYDMSSGDTVFDKVAGRWKYGVK